MRSSDQNSAIQSRWCGPKHLKKNCNGDARLGEKANNYFGPQVEHYLASVDGMEEREKEEERD